MLDASVVEGALEKWRNWEWARQNGWHEGTKIPIQELFRSATWLAEMLLEIRPRDIIRYCPIHNRFYLTEQETIYGCEKCHNPSLV